MENEKTLQVEMDPSGAFKLLISGFSEEVTMKIGNAFTQSMIELSRERAELRRMELGESEKYSKSVS